MDALLNQDEVSNLIMKNCEKYSISKLKAMDFINNNEIGSIKTMREVLSFLEAKRS